MEEIERQKQEKIEQMRQRALEREREIEELRKANKESDEQRK